MEDSIINILANDNYIIVNRSLIKELGLKEAIILGELASEYNYYKNNESLDENGYFYSTIENIQENTSLSSYEQKKCLDNLSKRGFISLTLKGVPAKRHIKINPLPIINLFANNLETSFRKIKKLDSEKLGTNNNNIKNNKEDKKEIYKERFKKPTLEEVKEYCKQRNSSVNPNVFYEYFETGNWVDSKGNKVKNWKQKIITWEKQQPKQKTANEEIIPDWFNKDLNKKEDKKESDLTDEQKDRIKRILANSGK